MDQKNKFSRLSLDLSDIVDHLFTMQEQNKVDDALVVRLLVFLQKDLDFEAISSVLMSRKRSDLLFTLFSKIRECKEKLVLAAFIESVAKDELFIAFKIWRMYELELTSVRTIEPVLEALVKTFEGDEDLFEVKIYLLVQVRLYLTYEHVDRLLTSLEDRFGDVAEDGSNSFLLNNLNPIKTACHMLLLLDLMDDRYPMTSLRTEQLSDIIMSQAKAVLEHLFLPRQILFQLK